MTTIARRNTIKGNSKTENLPIPIENKPLSIEAANVVPQEEIKTPKMLWQDFLESVESGTFSLSFSKLKAFRTSPYHFYQYVTKTYTTTDAMRFGQVDHCLILEGLETFKANYFILDRHTDLRGKESKGGKIGKSEFDELVEAAKAQGKEVVKLQDFEKALAIREMLLNDGLCKYLLTGEGESEKWFEYGFSIDNFTYKMRGRIDRVGNGFKLDLKNINGLDGKNLSYYVKANLIHVQAAVYQLSNVGFQNDDFYIIGADTNAVLPIKLHPQTIQKGKDELQRILEKFEMCYLENRWFESLGFWHDFNFLTV